MIGTSIRSVRHLYRVSDTSLRTILIKFKENAWDFCKVIKLPKESPFGENLFIFNNYIRQSHWGYDTVITSDAFKKYAKQEDVMGCCRLLSISQSELKGGGQYFQEVIMLPNSFEKDYEKFTKENSKMITSFIDKFGISTRDTRVKMIYIYSEGSKNFFQWAINAYYQNGVALSTIRNILLWNDSYKQLTKNLKKGTITAYTSRDSVPMLLNELDDLRREKRISDSINSFNTAQKKMLKENDLSNDDKQALWRLSKLSETKRLNFIKKMSSVEDIEELKRQLRFVTSVHFSWNKKSFMDFLTNVENIKYEKILDKDNVVLVKVLDYETIKQLGKTTNWCISKNKQYWNNYIENYNGSTTQYMVFDFSKLEDDKLSIIGFTTTHNKGITSAHNFVNDNLMGNNEGEQYFLNSFTSKFKETKNIYSILADEGIDITLVVQYDMPPFKWDEDSLMDYLYECVNPENVEIISKKDGKIALSVMDENVRYFFGDSYHDNISRDYYGLQHIIFIDFNKSVYDTNKLQFAIIEEGCGDEDYCIGLYNERSLNTGGNFDTKLIEFGLPYNTIRRTNDIKVRLRNAICSYNMPMVEDCLKECDATVLKKIINNTIGPDQMFDIFLRSIREYMSFDYLNLMYDNNIYLIEIMGKGLIGDLVKQLAYDIRCISRGTEKFKNFDVVEDSDIENFFNQSINTREDTRYVGLYVALKKIINNEFKKETNDLARNLVIFMATDNKVAPIFDQIINLFKDNFNFSKKCDALYYLIKYTVFYGGEELKQFVDEKCKSSQDAEKILIAAKNDYEKHLALTKKKKKAVSSYTVETTANVGRINVNEALRDLEFALNERRGADVNNDPWL